jgi:hypothetical protein
VDRERGFRSNLRVRHAYKQVHSQTSKIVPSVMGFDPPISVRPNDQNSEIAELKAKAVQGRLKYNFFQKQQAIPLVYRWIHQGERLGLSPMKLFWAYEEGEKRITRVIRGPDGAVIGVDKFKGEKYVIKDWPENCVVDTRRFWWNPDCVDPSELRYTFEVYYKPLPSLVDNPLYMNIDKVKGMSFSQYDRDSQQERTGAQSGRFIDTGERMVEIIERWDADNLIVVAENQVIRMRDNPHDDRILPYYLYRSNVVDDALVGMGSMEPVLELEDEANTHLNQRLDNVHRLVHRQILAGTNSGLNMKRMTFVPCGIHKVTDINQVKWFEQADVTQSSYLEESKAIDRMDEINGDPDFTRGETPGRRSSATEINQRSAGAGLRADLKTQFAFVEMGRMFRDMYRLERQFGDPNRVVQVQGDEGQFYSMTTDELFTEEYDFDFTLGGYLGNRLIDFQNMMTSLSIIGQSMPGVLQRNIEEDELIRFAFERSNVKGADRFMKKPMAPMAGYFRDPYDENKRMFFGEDVVVLPGDKHGYHMPRHAQLLDIFDMPIEVRARTERHLMTHYAMMMKDQAVTGSIGGQIAAQGQGPATAQVQGPNMLPSPMQAPAGSTGLVA